ncbi:T9SS type A sorting domain-containing protein [Flavobacterium sp. BFFFF1]|uniref:T9SS type A sorting domain-containing protein n=1 Tax=Flavobacterium sp. BFFFF1 TaxID=2015557 RepID=UPI0025C6CED5|nr:T9SS type A sorting domain-containing protein [Flavobacterium sp. BFFFF1]
MLLLTGTSHAQTWQWAKSGGSTDATQVARGLYEQVVSMATDSQDNVYILAYTGIANLLVDGHSKPTYSIYDGGGGTNIDYVLASFACDGTYRWAQVIGGQYSDYIQMLQVDAQDNIYIAGQSYNHIDDFNFPGSYAKVHLSDAVTWPYAVQNPPSGYPSLFIAKYDSNGNVLWYDRPQAANLPSSQVNAGLSIDLQTDELGNSYWMCYLVPGTYANGTLTVTQNAYYILKYDATGTFTGYKLVDLQVTGDIGLMQIRMRRNHHNGNWYLSGSVDRYDNNIAVVIGGQVEQYSKFIAAFDASDNFLWMRENNTTLAGFARGSNDLAFDEQDNIYLTGEGGTIGSPLDPDPVMESFNGNQITAPSNIIQIPCPYLVKLDPQGNNIWFTSGFDKFSEVAGITINGNEVAYCSQHAGIQWGNISIPYANKGKDPYVARFNRDTGAVIAIETLTSTTNVDDGATAITHDTQGNYLVGGRFWNQLIVGSTTLSDPGSETNFFVAKFGAACNLGTETPETAVLKAYPNPVTDLLHLDNSQNMDYALYSLTGALLQDGSLQPHASIDLQGIAAGLYLLELRDHNGSKTVIKIVKQ